MSAGFGVFVFCFSEKKKMHSCFISPSSLAVQERLPKALCAQSLHTRSTVLGPQCCSLTLDDEMTTARFLRAPESLFSCGLSAAFLCILCLDRTQRKDTQLRVRKKKILPHRVAAESVLHSCWPPQD